MAFPGQVEALADAVQQDFFASQELHESGVQQVRQASIGITATGNLALTTEIEEKVEVEAEKSGVDLYLHIFTPDENASKTGVIALYCNRTLWGSRLPLYDVFHAWKIHLS